MNEASTKIEATGNVPKLDADDPAAEGVAAAIAQCMNDMKPLTRKGAAGDGKKGTRRAEKTKSEEPKTEAHIHGIYVVFVVYLPGRNGQKAQAGHGQEHPRARTLSSNAL